MDDQLEKNNTETGIALALGLVFVSGFVALIYQVLWMKQLGLLFGNTSHAASATLASFFAGLAAGSWFLGRRVSTSKNPMLTYAYLEIGIAITALLYFIILGIFQMIYPSIYQSVGNGAFLLLIKFALSLLLIFPPAFCMGGTIPVMGQFMIRKRDAFGKISALMYGINTLGAATGAALAGFYLPLWLGFNLTCGLAIALSVGVAIAAFRLSRGSIPATIDQTDPVVSKTEENTSVPMTRQERRAQERLQKNKKQDSNDEPVIDAPILATQPASRKAITVLCFLSGFGILALEVLWTRMFTYVLDSSVYTFASILVIVLICLALGALFSSLLARFRFPPLIVLSVLMLAGAGAIAATPMIFMGLTNDMEMITSQGTWSAHMLLIFGKVALTIGPSAIILGMIFPYLMKSEEKHLKSPGLSLGRLATINTIGAILGALLCGFLLLDGLGMWRSLQLIAILYLFVALIIPLQWDTKSLVTKASCLTLLLVTIISFDPSNIPLISTDPNKSSRYNETVLEIWEGSDCTVAVTEMAYDKSIYGDRPTDVAIKINPDYSLGNTEAYMQEKFQADLPLWVYPETESIFFLGVGTGITAGGALDPKHQYVKRIVACELVPEVITAAKKYMTNHHGVDFTGGLFRDSRATVLAEDGRHHLMATDEKFNMINADLFVPYRSGAGSLYTKEHFENSKKRLSPDGVFVQWLPLYQLTENEFSIIAKTMLEVFDQVSLWRHNFQPDHEVVALVGHHSKEPLPACNIDSLKDKRFAVAGKTHRDLFYLQLPLDSQTIMLFYGGNLTEARSIFDPYPINTDDRPVIEYMAPRSIRQQPDGKTPWFLGDQFADFVDKVQKICPPETDPLLANRSTANRRLPLAGSAFHRAGIATVAQDEDATRKAWEEFVTEWTDR